jgi:hypothetical protein
MIVIELSHLRLICDTPCMITLLEALLTRRNRPHPQGGEIWQHIRHSNCRVKVLSDPRLRQRGKALQTI